MHTQKGFAPIVIVFTIGIIAIIAGVISGIGKTIVNQPSKETDNWNTYSNEMHHYSIKYPNEWKIYNVREDLYYHQLEIRSKDYKEKKTCLECGWELQNGARLSISSAKDPIGGSLNGYQNFLETESLIAQPPEPISLDGIKAIKFYVTHGNPTWEVSYIKDGKQYFISLSHTEKDKSKYLSIFDQILATFRFMDVAGISPSSKISQAEALEKVRNLSEVKDYLTRVPAGRVEFSHEDEVSGAWVIHMYEIVRDHTATSNWYSVNKETGKITDNLGKEY